MSEDSLIFGGADDGHREVKVSFIINKKSVKLITPSRAMSGLSSRISINGAKSSIFTYSSDNGIFSLGDVESAEDTGYDEYPFSAQNRVIVAHSLRLVGLTDKDSLAIISGLPLKRFYLGGKPNVEVIKRKKSNLLMSDVKGRDGYLPPKIVKHDVLPEAIAAWVNYIMLRNQEGKLYIDKERVSQRTAVIDIGGRTLDIAVVKDWDLDKSRSTSDEIGMINIIEEMRERLYDIFKGSEPTDEQVEQAVNTGSVTAWGEIINVSAEREEVIMTVLNSLKATIMRRLRNTQDIHSVLFVGGTSKFLEKYLVGWFKNQISVDDPVFANADGMLKYAEYMMGKK